MEIRFAILEDIPGIIDLLKQVGSVHHQGRPDIFRSTAQKYGPSQIIAMLDAVTDARLMRTAYELLKVLFMNYR